MIPHGFHIYLASRSPRRRELLSQIGVAFEVLVLRECASRGPDVDESPHAGESPDDYVQRVCRAKALAAWQRIEQRRLPRLPVLAADTAVCLESEILGKPRDRAEARGMLVALSGREHCVLTAVTLQVEERAQIAVSKSWVRLRILSEGEIAAYIASGEPLDKAGAYAIQGRAAAFIPELRGSYSGVMGLPLSETAVLIERLCGQS
jgi:septum formation protein